MVELVTVMVIIGIVALFVAPRFFDTSPFAERGFYEDSLAALRYAQKFAVASGCTVTAQFNGGYTLTQSACPDGSAGAVQRPGGGPFSNTAPAGVAVPPASVTFDKIGRTSATVPITVGTRIITVEAETGFVQ